MKFTSEWAKAESNLQDPRSLNSICHSVPIKPRIDASLSKIDVQLVKWDHILQELKLIDDMTSTVDIVHSRRKIIQIILLSKIAFEILKNKLLRISNFEDIVIVLAPAIAVVRNIRASLISCLPESEDELGIISELLGCILIDAGQVGAYTINFEIANEEALRLLNEASLTSAQHIKKIFSEISNYQ